MPGSPNCWGIFHKKCHVSSHESIPSTFIAAKRAPRVQLTVKNVVKLLNQVYKNQKRATLTTHRHRFRHFSRGIFHAVFDYCSSFFAPKPHRNPCYADQRARDSRAPTHEYFLSVETASTLLYAQESTTAQLRSNSCFSDGLVILNEVRTLSDDLKKEFRRKSKEFSDCRAISFLKTLPVCRAYR